MAVRSPEVAGQAAISQLQIDLGARMRNTWR
jgi:hypothetical protein